MGLRSGAKRVSKRFLDVRTWSSYDQVRSSLSSTFKSAKGLFSVRTSQRVETFEQAMQRLQLSEQDIQERMNFMLRLARLFTLMSVVVVGYALYLIVYHGSFFAFMLSVVIAGLAFLQAFRYHFWYMQTKMRRLGCTVQDYWCFLRTGALREQSTHVKE